MLFAKTLPELRPCLLLPDTHLNSRVVACERRYLFAQQAGVMPGIAEDTLLLWTEYVHHESYVCIPIVQSSNRGFVTYGTAEKSKVVLVGNETLAKFGILEIYFTISHQRNGSMEPWGYQTPKVLEVVLTSLENKNLLMTYAAAFPASINFLDQKQGGQLDQRRMLPHNFGSIMSDFNFRRRDRRNMSQSCNISPTDFIKQKDKWRDWPLSLKFHIAVVGAAERIFKQPRCHVWIRDDSNDMFHDDENQVSWFDEGSYEYATDRAETQVLDGTVVLHVSIKWLGESTFQQNSAKPLRHSVQLALNEKS